MPDEAPEVIEKDGSWAYRIGGMTFGRYPSREAALIASAKHEGEHPEPVEREDQCARDPDDRTQS